MSAKEPKMSLKAARVNAGLNINEVADALKVSRATVSAWENGKSEPRVSQFNELCILYKTPSQFIFFN